VMARAPRLFVEPELLLQAKFPSLPDRDQKSGFRPATEVLIMGEAP
jgi:hypothetical protein